MMKGIRTLLAYCVTAVTVFFTQCREYEFPVQPYPRLRTAAVAEISETGALFFAEVVTPGTKRVTDHGFLWSLRRDPREYNSEKVALGPLGNKRSFEARVAHGLFADTTYYVRCFTRTDDHVVLGPVVHFRSSGSKAPRIDEVAPRAGVWGDTVSILGAYFSGLATNVVVYFGEKPSRVVVTEESRIVAVVPDGLADSLVDVRVVVAERAGMSPYPFALVPPEIHSFQPLQATFGDVITITGAHFSRHPSDNKVYFNEFAAEVLQGSDTILRVAVPPSLDTMASRVRVITRLRSAESEDQFLLAPPVIHTVSPLVAVPGTLVTIEGMNFATHQAGNDVMFGENEARVHAAKSTELKVVVPEGPYVDPSNVTVTLTVAGQRAQWTDGLRLSF